MQSPNQAALRAMEILIRLELPSPSLLVRGEPDAKGGHTPHGVSMLVGKSLFKVACRWL